MAAGDTAELLAAVVRRTKLPRNALTLTDADMLRLATDQMLSVLVPLVMAQHQDYFEVRTELPLVAGQRAYRVPSRAMHAKLRSAVLANPTTGDVLPLERIAADRWRSDTDETTPTHIATEGAQVLLYPRPDSASTAYKLRLVYYSRPGDLVLPAAATTWLGVTGPGDAHLANASALGSEGQTVSVDVVRGQPPYETVAVDQVGTLSLGASSLVGNTLEGAQVGDYVCLAGTSPVPQVPRELHPLLISLAAAEVLSASGDSQGASEVRRIAEQQAAAARVMVPRVEGSPARIPSGWRRWARGGPHY